MQNNWKNSSPHLDQARVKAQAAVVDLENASEALRLFAVINEKVQGNPACQEHLETIEKRLIKARYQITEVDRLTEEIEQAWGE